MRARLFIGTFALGALAGMASCKVSTEKTNTPKANLVRPTYVKSAAAEIELLDRAALLQDVLIADLGPDSRQDLIALTTRGAQLYRNLDGKSWRAPEVLEGTAGLSIAAGAVSDFNGDGFADILIYQQSQKLGLYFGNKEGLFSAARMNVLTGAPASRTLSSLSVMNYQEIERAGEDPVAKAWIFGGASGGNHFRVRERLGDFQPETFVNNPENIPTGTKVKVLSADFDRDGYKDFIVVPLTVGVDISILRNIKNDHFEYAGSISRAAGGASISDAAVYVEGVTPHLLLATSAGFQIYKNSGAFRFDVGNEIQPSNFPFVASSFAFADATGDTLEDLWMARAGAPSVLLSRAGTFAFADISSVALQAGRDSSALKTAVLDMNGDGLPDLVEAFSNGRISIYLHQ